MHKYNSSLHRTIGMPPDKVKKGKVEQQLLRGVYRYIKQAGRGKFKVGDYVQVGKYKKLFSKGYDGNWVTEIFHVVKKQITNPVTHIFEDLQRNPIIGGFYKEELKFVPLSLKDYYWIERVLRTKGNKVDVKWLGFSNKHNSWMIKKMFCR